jgi:hypothetical protein
MANVQPLNNISDDDELASVLAGVKNEAAALDSSMSGSTSSIASLPPVPPIAPPTLDFEETSGMRPISDITPPTIPAPVVPGPSITTPVASSPELEALKKETLSELRPLVGKLDLPAEEKFDTLLLIIRSTDDQSLLAPAHEAAKSIGDEARRASALLDIIKEIDYFSNKA